MPLPRIAVFSGSNSTIQNTPPMVTSEKARRAYGLLPSSRHPRFDALRPQRLAAPATVYVEQFSAHPLEPDVRGLFADPDGYVGPDGRFNEARQSPADVPVYRIVLHPDDGLYPLPYMGRQASGAPWEADPEPGAPAERTRQTFYADGSRLYEEIDRLGIDENGYAGQLSRQAEFSFFRAVPSGGYTTSGPASPDTPAPGPRPSERWGADFFPYAPHHLRAEPPVSWLAKAANAVQGALATGRFAAAQWLDASPTADEILYWLALVVDTEVPILGHVSQRPGQTTSFDGALNIVQGVRYLVSECWKDESGRDRAGPLIAVDGVGFSPRDVVKIAARPGGFFATGGQAGMVADLDDPPCVSYVPVKHHTWNSELRMTRLPAHVPSVSHRKGVTSTVPLRVNDDEGYLRESAMPMVGLFSYVRYRAKDELETTIAHWIQRALDSGGLIGLVFEGLTPYGTPPREAENVLTRAAYSGIPVVCCGRGLPAGRARLMNRALISGNNLPGPKARILLLGCLLKFGSLPPAYDPDSPSEKETAAIHQAVRAYQDIFDTH
jgi:L-asparaginase